MLPFREWAYLSNCNETQPLRGALRLGPQPRLPWT